MQVKVRRHGYSWTKYFLIDNGFAIIIHFRMFFMAIGVRKIFEYLECYFGPGHFNDLQHFHGPDISIFTGFPGLEISNRFCDAVT